MQAGGSKGLGGVFGKGLGGVFGKGGGSKGIGSIFGSGGSKNSKAGAGAGAALLVPAAAAGISQSGSSPASPEQHQQNFANSDTGYLNQMGQNAQHGYQGGRNNWAGSPDYGAYESRRYPANPRNSGIRALADKKMSFMVAAVLYLLA